MRNKVWLLALTLLVVYSGRVSGNDSHFRSALVAQQVNKKVVTGVVSDDMGPVIDRKSTRLNSSHRHTSRMPSSA